MSQHASLTELGNKLTVKTQIDSFFPRKTDTFAYVGRNDPNTKKSDFPPSGVFGTHAVLRLCGGDGPPRWIQQRFVCFYLLFRIFFFLMCDINYQ